LTLANPRLLGDAQATQKLDVRDAATLSDRKPRAPLPRKTEHKSLTSAACSGRFGGDSATGIQPHLPLSTRCSTLLGPGAKCAPWTRDNCPAAGSSAVITGRAKCYRGSDAADSAGFCRLEPMPRSMEKKLVISRRWILAGSAGEVCRARTRLATVSDSFRASASIAAVE
jgi:hypothetical protein